MKNKENIPFLYYLSAAILAYSFSQTTHAATNDQIFPMYSRIIGQATASDIGIFNIDAMAPVYGNADHILYINGIASYGTDTSQLASIGIGTRNILENNCLLGGYVFYDWSQAEHGSNFPVLNPGFEFMHNRWDLHINGYLPIHEQESRGFNTASNLGNDNYLYFNQHAEYDKILAVSDVIGKGSDIETGYSIPFKKNRIRIFAGGYFYAPHNVNNITGALGGLEFPISKHLQLVLQDSYDNIFHNTAAITVKFTLGGIQQTGTDQLQERLLDPIPRHLGTLHTGSGVLEQHQLTNTGRSVMVNNNLWFFQPGTGNTQTITQDSCTFEHPCIGLAQSTINGVNNISPNAKFYLASGQYNNAAAGNGFALNPGQSLLGRTQNYLYLAQGEQRALVNDTVFLNGDNIVSNMQINASRAGIIINQSAIGTIQINNSNITAATADANHEAIGIINSSLSATVSLKNSTVTALASGTGSNSMGLINKGIMQINSSTLSATNTATNTVGIGIFNEDFGQINITNSTVSANSPTFAVGIFNEDFGVISIANSTITANASTLAKGISNEDFGVISIANSTITANASILAEGIFNEDFGVINIANSIITANASTQATGIFNEDFGVIK